MIRIGDRIYVDSLLGFVVLLPVIMVFVVIKAMVFTAKLLFGALKPFLKRKFEL